MTSPNLLHPLGQQADLPASETHSPSPQLPNGQNSLKWQKMDPRWFQLGVLSSLILYALFVLKFDLSPFYIASILSSVVIFQTVFSKAAGFEKVELKSALISGMSLCLLFRTNSLLVALLAALISIGSKFTIRVRGKHLFNPTNFGIVAAMLISGEAWISPGQWGSFAFFSALTACLGFMVITRAKTVDLTVSFLIFYIGLLFYRAGYLGDPWAIPLHQLQSGSLIIFSFFMISDPRPTPNTRIGRLLFSLLTASIAYYFRFKLFNPNGLLYALVLSSLTVPLIDQIFKGDIYNWPSSKGSGKIRRGFRLRSFNTGRVPVPRSV